MKMSEDAFKLYRVLRNDSNHGRFPLPPLNKYLPVLSYRVNRSHDEVKSTLKELHEQEIIFLQDGYIREVNKLK